jgi:4-diphosphocytidyl-2-C-methyl-D-erythritol kinase
MPTAVRSHAKINLGLYVGAPREDGFHGLATVYQTLEVHDVVTVTARTAERTSIRLSSNDERVPADGRNTAWKMTELALASLGVTAEVEIHIDKRLPVQGGLGAGSANAVAALVGLETELALSGETGGFPGPQMRGTWGTQIPGWTGKRLKIAAQVGSDVPLFLIGGAILGTDRGQQVEPLTDFEATWCVIAIPEVGVSTPQAFRDWDALCAVEGLTAERSDDRLEELSRAFVSAFQGAIPEGRQGTGSSGVLSMGENLAGPQESALVRTGISSWIRNDFERVVFPQHPSLAEIRRILWASGKPEAALLAMLSGSGSSLFGLYQTREDAVLAQERLSQAGVRSILTRTLPREPYWREMLLHQED